MVDPFTNPFVTFVALRVESSIPKCESLELLTLPVVETMEFVTLLPSMLTFSIVLPLTTEELTVAFSNEVLSLRVFFRSLSMAELFVTVLLATKLRLRYDLSVRFDPKELELSIVVELI